MHIVGTTLNFNSLNKQLSTKVFLKIMSHIENGGENNCKQKEPFNFNMFT